MKNLFQTLILCLIISCTGVKNNTDTLIEGSPIFNITFKATPPYDVPENADSIDLIRFAWEEFIALNWQASYETTGLRDNPDTAWSWSSNLDSAPPLVVWETYAHRSELRPYSNKMLPFDAPPHYSFGAKLVPATLPNGQQASFDLFQNLDENNEIGSCNLYAHTNIYDEENIVLYQAKVNRDEYEYIYENYNTKEALKAANLKTLSNIKSDSSYYPGANGTCDCPKEEGVLCLPCGNSETETVGAIEIKTAWRVLVPEDTASTYFKRTAIYYDKADDGTITYSNKEFALIGLHIIHKTQNNQEFVFATWEHKDVVRANMGYRLLNSNTNQETGPLVSNYKRHSDIPAIVDQSTEEVHAQIRAKNPNSIWLNYRLVGVQGQPTNDSTYFSFFLANYVVESDPALSDFHGSSLANPHNKKPNTLSKKQMFSMGGCQGCHGVAQLTLGADFSFLMDTVGKPIDKPDLLDSIPSGEIGKLARYIRATSL